MRSEELNTAPSVTRHRLGGYREYAPPAALADCAEALWTHETPWPPAMAGATHRVLPDPFVSLAFMGFRRGDGEPIDWSPVIIGPKLRAQIFALVPGREVAAIKIKPEWTGPLIGIDPIAIEDRVADLASVAPRLADRVGDALSRTRSAADAVQVLTATLGLSARHVRRHVHHATGIAPKGYSRAVRLVSAMVSADRFESPAWAAIALDAGYCDQSHLIRDCVTLAGVSPRELHLERRGEVAGDPAVSVLSNRR